MVLVVVHNGVVLHSFGKRDKALDRLPLLFGQARLSYKLFEELYTDVSAVSVGQRKREISLFHVFWMIALTAIWSINPACV